MAIPTEQLLGLLRRGYTITTFYRLSAKAAFQSSVRIPEGYLLLSQNGEEEGVLTISNSNRLNTYSPNTIDGKKSLVQHCMVEVVGL